MLKEMAALAAVLMAGDYAAGAFEPDPYSRKVERPPAEVADGLHALDIAATPGAPGTDPSRSGGVKPLFRLDSASDHLTWFVMSGDKVATATTATLVLADDGRATLVKASVHRGDAPDDFVSPASRSEKTTMALEGELDRPVAPAPAAPRTCAQLIERFERDDMANDPAERPADLRTAMGDTSKTMMRLQAMEAEQRRLGCAPAENDGPFRSPSSEMTAD